MAEGLTSFDRAEQACLVFLGAALEVQVGDNKDISRGDYLEPDLVNKGVFSISGGPEQVQNYGVPAPGAAWWGNGIFLMQFETRPAAIKAQGQIQNKFPPTKLSCGLALQPNVSNFDVMEHPEIYSNVFANAEGEVLGLVYTLRARFRVIYGNN